MNEFVVEQKKPLNPGQVVLCVLGVSLDDLITAIRENRGGQYDHLYKQKENGAGQTRPASGVKKEADLKCL